MTYRVHFTNFHYYSANEAETLDGARRIAKDADFQATVEFNGETVASYHPDHGWLNLEQKSA
jgi:hypothetical protein